MTRGDALVERGAARLQALAEKAAGSGGIAARLAQPLAEDAAFLRRLKPSLIVARARGEASTDAVPGSEVQVRGGGPNGGRPRAGGPNPFLVMGVALAAGIALARLIDWRGHAHPRD